VFSLRKRGDDAPKGGDVAQVLRAAGSDVSEREGS